VETSRPKQAHRLSATGYRLSAAGYWLAAALVLATAACGKKGPPLAPIVRVPAPVTMIDARRIGSDVYLTVTLPGENIDGSTPADLQRVEVFGYTGRTPPGSRILEGATLIATIPVAPPLPEGTVAQAAPGDASAVSSRGAVQGTAVTVRDTLEGDELQPRTLPPPPNRRGQSQPPADAVSAAAPLPPVQRFYVAFGFSDRRRSSPGGVVTSLTLGPLPESPTALAGTYVADTVRLAWEPSGGLFGFLLDRVLPAEPSPADELLTPTPGSPGAPAVTTTALELPAGPTRYNLYREIAPDPLELPAGPAAPAWLAAVPRPLNTAPLAALTFDDPVAFDGRNRCYQVRSVRGTGATAVESDPSASLCFTPVDTVAPDAPISLAAEPGPGAISLIWDPNIDEDLGGYLILRGAPGDATLTPLTGRPIADSRYIDRTVVPGTRYVYAVVAVDNRVPLGNVSLESNRVEETAR
jgi:predicted small lipoprotein YifL